MKSGKFGIILKNIFYRGKRKSGKFLKNMLAIWEKWKNVVKSVKIEKFRKIWKVEKFFDFHQCFLKIWTFSKFQEIFEELSTFHFTSEKWFFKMDSKFSTFQPFTKFFHFYFLLDFATFHKFQLEKLYAVKKVFEK